MQFFDPNNPNEKKKLIAAAVLGVVALAVLGYVFFGGSSKKPATVRTVVTPSPTPAKLAKAANAEDVAADDPSLFQPIRFNNTVPAVSEPERNIFAYYVPPPPTPVPVKPIPTPTPTPTPPMTASALAPSNVYAGTPSDFSLQVMGDKFTSAVHILIDGRDMPTRFLNPQQVATTVPAAMITNPGMRQVIVRNKDGSLYSNSIGLNVAQAPVPNFSYVGLIAKPRGNDTAVVQDKNSKEYKSVQRGDLLGDRFRINSISEREILVIDTTLKIPHRIPFSSESGSNPRPAMRSLDDDP
jgi:hypothetical protein